MNTKALLLEKRLNLFGADVAIATEVLPRNYFMEKLKEQLLRSCVSPALNYGEAQAAESRRDFIHKMKICLKELKETYNCIEIIEIYLTRKGISATVLESPKAEALELIKIFVSSINKVNLNPPTNTL